MMKHSVQILLLFAFAAAPWFAGAEEETLEQRKRRIMRKYLRERAEITYDEEVVPSEIRENDELLASEDYSEYDDQFLREEGSLSAHRPLPGYIPQASLTENENWLLGSPEEAEESLSDFYSPEEAEMYPGEDEPWDTWGEDSEEDAYQLWQRMEEMRRSAGEESSYRYPYETDDTAYSGRQPYSSGVYGEEEPTYGTAAWESPSPYGTESETPYPSRFGLPDEQEAYGTEREPYSPYGSPQRNSYGTSPYGSPSSGTYSYPGVEGPRQDYSSTPSYTPYDSSSRQTGVYAPYSSPGQDSSEYSWGGNYSGYQQPESRPRDSYETWRERNRRQYDPTAADAYLREIAPQNRR